MSTETQRDEVDRLVAVFRVLADPTRLRILGALAERPRTGKELSEVLGLTPPTISHHMTKLTGVGLVRMTPDGTRRTYALDEPALRDVGRRVAATEPTAPPGGDAGRPDDGADPEERERAKILRDFFAGPRLKQIPAQRKKRVIVLQHLLERFAPDRSYPEQEVNDLLREAHDDVATLRRELVDYGFMQRERGIYRVAHAPPERSVQVAQEITGDEGAWLRSLIARATERAIAGR